MVKKIKMKRGVSPIVATLLLILIAVAAAAVLYVWVSSLGAQTQQSSVSNVASAIAIEATSIGTSDGNVTIYLRNIGSTQISGNFSIYIYNSTGAIVNSNFTVLTLNPGDLTKISYLAGNGVFTPSNVYNIKVVAPTGATAVASVKAS